MNLLSQLVTLPAIIRENDLTHDVRDIDIDALDALIERLNEARQYKLTLSTEDIELLLQALATLSTLQSSLESNDITIHKLRKLLGIVASSEKLKDLLKESSQTDTGDSTHASDTQPRSGLKLPRKKPERFEAAQPLTVYHPLQESKKGDRCPCCDKGTLSKYEPAVLLRITGQSPYQAVNHIQERVRCNACGEYFTAPLPKEVTDDGDANQKYGYTARSLMAMNKYFMGSPFFRQETLQNIMGVHITASTVFDQCRYVAEDGLPAVNYLIRLAANAMAFDTDDTSHLILDQKEIIKPNRKTQKPQKRTGTYASGLIATLASGEEIVLFKTNIGHAGEWIDEVTQHRDPNLAPPIVMSDALPSNRPTAVTVVQSLCNSHARRQFVDVLRQFPDEVSHVLHLYKEIWDNETVIKNQKLTPAQRLTYHREHSLPIMEAIRDWGEKQLADEHVEANSGLGKAIQYYLKNYEGLTCFCTVEGAKIDNNRMEAQLKLIVRGRKNFSFYKTQAGADISDVLTSLIATSVAAKVNPFDYLTALQRHRDQVKMNPGSWLPWNYHLNG